MGDILKLPTSTLGYKRVKRRARAESPGQLDLFPAQPAQILQFVPPGLSPFERALLSDERGDDRAAELYSQAIAEHDCVADAFCNLGIIESQKGNVAKAVDCFTTCLKQDPRHTEAHYNLGNLYFEINDFRLAQIHFEIAAEVNPAFANAHFNLALARAINKNAAGALESLARYQELVCEEDGRAARAVVDELSKSIQALNNSRTVAR